MVYNRAASEATPIDCSRKLDSFTLKILKPKCTCQQLKGAVYLHIATETEAFFKSQSSSLHFVLLKISLREQLFPPPIVHSQFWLILQDTAGHFSTAGTPRNKSSEDLICIATVVIMDPSINTWVSSDSVDCSVGHQMLNVITMRYGLQ